MNKLKAYFITHKTVSIVAIVIILVGGFFTYRSFAGSSSTPKYILTKAKIGTLISTVTGTGQVAAVNQVALTSKVSGSVSYLPVKVGQAVFAGQTIAQIGGTDAANAAFDLENSRVTYDNLIASNDTTLLKAQNSLSSAQDSLNKDYTSAYNTLVSANNDLSNVVTQINSFYSSGGYIYNFTIYAGTNRISDETSSRIIAAQKNFSSVKNDFNTAQNAFSAVSRSSSNSDIERVLTVSLSAARKVSQMAKDTVDLLNFLRERENGSLTSVNAAITQAAGYSSSAATDVSNILTAQNSISADKQSLTEAQSNLSDVKSGASGSDLRSQQLSIRQKEQTLSDYTITSPFAGIIGALSVSANDNVDNGTAIATVITRQNEAVITLNEVDAAKVKSGDPATLTFDALPNVTASGTVVEIDSVGTVSQGVVSYSAKVSIDLTDSQIKPGMSVSVSIVIDSKPNVLLVPSGAVKTSLRGSYVQTLPGSVGDSKKETQTVSTTETPTQVEVKIGQSNDTMVEITSGLKEGDWVISRTVTSGSGTTANTTTSSSKSSRSLLGGGGPGF